uniref:Uncharacterized protein n=1 Tax=Romanomermis culicivorax TaxID=13658 RepID=A0A915K3B4_ROMCU
MLLTAPEPSDDELLETPIFDLIIAKLPTTVTSSSPTSLTTTANLTVSTTSINEFLKLMLDDISSLAPVPAQELMPIQFIVMDTKADVTTASDHTLTDIMEETTVDKVTAMDVAPPAPVIDPLIYLATQVVLPSPAMIATVAPAWYIPPVRFLQQIISDTQLAALAAALKGFNFRPPPPDMVFPEHH